MVYFDADDNDDDDDDDEDDDGDENDNTITITATFSACKAEGQCSYKRSLRTTCIREFLYLGR